MCYIIWRLSAVALFSQHRGGSLTPLPMCLLRCSVEVSSCLDPGYYVQKSVKSKQKLAEERDGGLSKYMKKGLSLPMNTFAGIIS